MKYKLVKYCEFDKYAVKSYNAIHNTTNEDNLGDVYNADFSTLSNIDLIVGGVPCTDFSIAGKQKGSIWECLECNHKYNPLEQTWNKRDCCPICGSTNLDKTNSSLVIEYLRAIRECNPKFFLFENVKNIVGKKHEKTFNLFIKELESYNYTCYYKIMNAKDYGTPQNRNRVFVVGIHNSINKGFEFLEPYDNGIRLKDLKEDIIDEKYYLSESLQKHFIDKSLDMEKKGNGFRFKPHNPSRANISFTITTRAGQRIDDNYILENDIGENNTFEFTENNLIKLGYLRNDSQGNRVYDINNISCCINAQSGGLGAKTGLYKDVGRIRRLTPLECFRLMGFDDEDLHRAQAQKISDTQLYKQAGNSIAVPTLEGIYKQLKLYYPDDFTESFRLLSLFSGIGAFEKALTRV